MKVEPIAIFIVFLTETLLPDTAQRGTPHDSAVYPGSGLMARKNTSAKRAELTKNAVPGKPAKRKPATEKDTSIKTMLINKAKYDSGDCLDDKVSVEQARPYCLVVRFCPGGCMPIFHAQAINDNHERHIPAHAVNVESG